MDAQRAVATSDVFFKGKDLVKVSRQSILRMARSETTGMKEEKEEGE